GHRPAHQRRALLRAHPGAVRSAGPARAGHLPAQPSPGIDAAGGRQPRLLAHVARVPELPEVEINARNLRRWTAGRTIVAASAPRSRVLRPADPGRFVRGLAGRRVGPIERVGKHLLIPLLPTAAADGGGGGRAGSPLALYSHLGMTGKWVRIGPG